MRVFDGHCDVLCKMLLQRSLTFDGEDAGLDVTLPRLKKAETFVQCFAIFIPESLCRDNFSSILESVDLFMTKIISNKKVKWIRTSADLENIHARGGVGAMLTLEGVDGLEGKLSYLRVLKQLGVRNVGITWNHANWAADGVMEPRGGGLTLKGKQLIRACNELHLVIDVSHLSERGFWDVAECTEKPFIASHSNAYSVCKHPRNLKDDQILAIIQSNGRLGITFVPQFLKNGSDANVNDVIRHIDYICALGGMNVLCFGSDFDGIDAHVKGLEHPGCYDVLYDELLKRYKKEWVERWMYGNWMSFYLEHLPKPDQAN